jgi:hypothetical protein
VGSTPATRTIRNLTQLKVRNCALCIPVDPKLYIPALLEALGQKQYKIERESILFAFEQFGDNAKAAVLTLVELVSGQYGDERSPILIYLAAVDRDSAQKLGAEEWLLKFERTNPARLRAVFRPTTNSVNER